MDKAIVATGNSIDISRRYAPWFIERSISGQRPFFQLNRHPSPMVIEVEAALTATALAYTIRRLFAHNCRATSTDSLQAVSCLPTAGPTQLGGSVDRQYRDIWTTASGPCPPDE